MSFRTSHEEKSHTSEISHPSHALLCRYNKTSYLFDFQTKATNSYVELTLIKYAKAYYLSNNSSAARIKNI
mgnify:CR=1 FL=1